MAGNDAEEQARIAEANRAKTKELDKREELYRAKIAALLQAKTVVESLNQELDARQVVLSEAELKHGTLLKREEDVEVRERDIADRERQLNDRSAALASREEALDAEAELLRKEHDQRMFPLAALEQEVYRREQELRTLEAEHEGKLRAFQKRVHAEEERERAKEKQVRDLENRAKDALTKVQAREKEVEQQLAFITEKNKTIKTGQVELESRDRDLKWRDEQLRLAQADVHVTKGRLMTWERELDLRNEGLEVKTAELAAREQDLAMKELAISDRMSRLLAAEKELERREASTAKGLDDASHLRRDAESAQQAALRQRSDAEQQAKTAAALKEELEKLKAAAAKKDEAAAKRKAKLDEKERAVKDWVAELEWREQQLVKRESQYGRDLHAATGGTVSLATLQQQQSSGGGDTSPAESRPAQLNSGIVRMQLSRIQESYLAGSAQPVRRTKSKPAMNITSASPVSLPFDASKDTSFLAKAEEEATVAELDRHVREVAAAFAQCSVKFYSMSDDGVRHVFSARECDQFKQCFEAEEQWKEDVRFIDTAFGLQTETGSGGSAGKLTGPASFTSAVEWNAWFKNAKTVARRRKYQLQTIRLSKLSSIVSMFQQKEETEALSQYFPLNHYRILRQKDGERHKPAAAFFASATENRSAALSSGDEHDDGPASRQEKPGAARGQQAPLRPVEQAQNEIRRVLDSLPPYLRKHYQPEESSSAPPPG